MKLFEVKTWSNSVRWIFFLPISILAFIVLYLISLLGELRFPGGTFVFYFMLQLTGRPITAYVGMYIVPKAKKTIGIIYCLVYLLDLASNIVSVVNGEDALDKIFFGNNVGILLGTVVTIFLVITTDVEDLE